MIEVKELMPGVTLRCCPDTRFKHGCLSFQLVRPMGEEEAGLNALLPSILLRGTKAHPDLRSITMALDELYGAAMGPLVRRIGDYQTTGLFCSFVEDRYCMPGDRVLEPLVEFLGEVLLEPLLQGDGFVPEIVESEKKNLISTIEAERNDKRAYAMGQMLRLMCKGDSFGIPRLGEKERVAAITPEQAYADYRRMLSESPIELFYVGSAAPEQVAALVMPILNRIPRNVTPLPGQKPFAGDEGGTDTAEYMDVAQAKLCMGFTTPITNSSEEHAAMQVLNVVYGSGAISKLFMNVRERLSLCYSVGSVYYGAKGIMAVSAGIDAKMEQQARKEILAQLDACRRGDITDEEMAAAKETLLSSLRTTHDSPGTIESYYATTALSGMNKTPERYSDAIRAVTREQVMAAANSLRLHTIYCLKGESE